MGTNRIEAILEASLPVFMEKGFIRTTMSDLAAAAGMSVGELSGYFRETGELFKELVNSMDKQKFDSIDEYGRQSESCWEEVVKFLKLAEYQMEIVNEQSLLPAVLEFNMMSWRDKKNQEFIHTRYESGTQGLYEFFKKGVDRGEFHPLLPLETIVGFTGTLINGLIITVQLIGNERVDYKGQMEALKQYLQHVLQVKTEQID